MHTTRKTAALAASLALALTLAAIPSTAQAQSLETLFLFDPLIGETPESIVFDHQDNAYVTLAFNGQVLKLTPDLSPPTVLATLPIDAPCGPVAVVALGLAVDKEDSLYGAVFSCDPANSGIWQIDTADGSITQLAVAPSFVVWNGIDVHKGFIYAADTFGGLIWRIPAAGGLPEIWADDPLLKIVPGSPFPGPNGLQYYKGSIYTANSSAGTIVEIPILPSGAAGQAAVHATLPFPQGCDEFTFDVLGRIYCTTDPFNTLVRLNTDGTSDVLFTAADLLDGPTSVAFGRKGTNKKNLYVTNAAFPIFSTTLRASLMRVRLELPGAPDEY